MDDLIKDYEDIALSDNEVMNLVDGRANIILYPQLINYTSIDQMLSPYGACFLLFLSKPNYGHWCVLIKTNDSTIEFFNPYGGFPDDSLNYIPIGYRKESNQYNPTLSQLMYDSPYNLEYNEFKFQSMGKNIKTCGRHCAIRILFKYLTIEKYASLLDKLAEVFEMGYDELVTFLTMYINK
jgi:hypothetical protein